MGRGVVEAMRDYTEPELFSHRGFNADSNRVRHLQYFHCHDCGSHAPTMGQHLYICNANIYTCVTKYSKLWLIGVETYSYRIQRGQNLE